MSQNKGNHDQEKLLLKGKVEFNEKPKDHLEHSEDAIQARESSKEERNKALDSNKNRHDGSAGGHGESIEVVIRDEHGHEKMSVSRQKGGTEKDIERYEANKKSISNEELQALAQRGELSASRFLERLNSAKTEEEKRSIQKEVDKWFSRGEFGQQRQNDDTVGLNELSREPGKHGVDTKILESIKSDPDLPIEKRQLASYLQEMRAASKELGESTEPIDSFAQLEFQQEINERTSKKHESPTGDLKQEILRALVRAEINELKRGVGIVHGTLNFVVNTMAGVGNAVRMAGAANYESTPLARLCPDLYPDKEATEMLHKTVEGTLTTARVINQLSTTFNPTSPLFGIEYDPNGAAMTRALAKALPEKISHEIEKFATADPETQSAIATEAVLNIVILIDSAGLGSAAKIGENELVGSLTKAVEETSALRELVQGVNVTRVGENLTPATAVANTVAKNLEHHAELFRGLAENQQSLRTLAQKFTECLTNFNDANKADYAITRKGTIKNNDALEVVQNTSKELETSTDRTQKSVTAITNQISRDERGKLQYARSEYHNESAGERAGGKKTENEKSKTGSDNLGNERDQPLFGDGPPPWDIPEEDIAYTEELLKNDKAEWAGPEDCRRLRLKGETPRRPFLWKAVGEVFSKNLPRQITNESCGNAVAALLSDRNIDEETLIKLFPPRAAMRDLAEHINGKALSVPLDQMKAAIEGECKRGPWAAKLYDGEDWHLLMVQLKNESTGRLRIHDTYEGTKYEMDIDEFNRVWTTQYMQR
jgi:hypothetical protein